MKLSKFLTEDLDTKTVTLTLTFDERVEDIVDRSVQFQDSEILEDWEDLFDVHTVLEEINVT